jgi:diguanylate cyclase (GGDEF)-like protein/PAS domain S-box-containing protein
MLGAGFYTDDIDGYVLQLLLGAGVVLVLVTAGALLLVTYVTHSISVPMGEAVVMIEALERGQLSHRLRLDQSDEVGRLARAMDAFADNLQHEVLTAFDHLARGDFSFEAKGLIREPLAGANALLNALVAELDRTAAAARAEKSKIEGLIAAMGDGVAILDPGMKVIYQNPIHIKQVGHRVGELCFHSEANGDRVCGTCPARQALVNGKVHRLERRLSIDGREVFIEATASPVRNEAGELVALIEIARDVTDRKQAEKRVEYLAFHDPLTGLANRALLEDRLALALAASRRDQAPGSLFFIDLDRFKTINDSLGHHVGDLLLQEAANRLQALVRSTDTVCRSGGDEFILLLPQLDTATDAAHLAEKIISRFSQPFVLEAREVFISPSIGISMFPGDGADFATLSRHADAAMYQAKEQGRNNFQFFKPELAAAVQERLELENELRQALAGDELQLHYQPQFDAVTGRIVGAEALARWVHPQRGCIPPNLFIPIAEECNLIEPLGFWALRLACLQNRQWQMRGFAPIRMAVNISGRQFRQPNFIATVDRILAETGLDPRWLEMEVTERVLMENVEATLQTLAALKARRISLAIDDFGTGYSSLSYLRQFPVDRLKIDRSFVTDIVGNADAAAIASAVIGLAKSLNLEVVAEGVETAEQANFLCARQCHLMQGYYFARPATAETFQRLFENTDPHLKSRFSCCSQFTGIIGGSETLAIAKPAG